MKYRTTLFLLALLTLALAPMNVEAQDPYECPICENETRNSLPYHHFNYSIPVFETYQHPHINNTMGSCAMATDHGATWCCVGEEGEMGNGTTVCEQMTEAEKRTIEFTWHEHIAGRTPELTPDQLHMVRAVAARFPDVFRWDPIKMAVRTLDAGCGPTVPISVRLADDR